ncbi:MAG: ABC transporter permease [Crocinitomicaceae bacterium]|nr:ABC transporter permease [Crocinitomicaceae bacterium]MBK8924342.1 ABC transporter permease [Crocinitomicaceae bacterium]
MNVKLLFNVARSLLFARWKQTLVAAVGVTFSITMFIALLSFMEGLNDLLDNLMINRTPHVRLYKEITPTEIQPVQKTKDYKQHYHFIQSIRPKLERPEIQNSFAIMNALRQDSRVLGVAPKVTAQVFYNLGKVNLMGSISGIEPVAENSLFAFSDYITTGNYQDLINVPNSIILGKAAAEIMMVEPGDAIQVTTPFGERVSLRVVGLFESGLMELDKVQSYASVSTCQKLLGESASYITDINIKLHDMSLAPELAKEYSELFNVEAIDIETANSQFETGTFVRTLISYAVGITLLIVAGFGIYNILNMMIYEKMDSIAILKATGFSGKDVNRIFIIIALSIGIFGGFLGLLFGFFATAAINQIPFETEALPNITTYPVVYNLKFYLIGGIFSIVTTYLAGYFPSRKASKVDPVVIIRGK